MYYCHDCKHWHSVWAFKTVSSDHECGLCDICLQDLPGKKFKDCEDLAYFINKNCGLVDYLCGSKRKCGDYERREESDSTE